MNGAQGNYYLFGKFKENGKEILLIENESLGDLVPWIPINKNFEVLNSKEAKEFAYNQYKNRYKDFHI